MARSSPQEKAIGTKRKVAVSASWKPSSRPHPNKANESIACLEEAKQIAEKWVEKCVRKGEKLVEKCVRRGEKLVEKCVRRGEKWVEKCVRKGEK